jgi:serine/threonine protein kinase
VSEPVAGMLVTSNVRLVRPLGQGGMGSVWVAEHLSLKTHVVVKFMARELADSKEALARFSREAAAASQVKSPHVVQTFDHGVRDDGRPYIVMELLEGRDLDQHLADRGKLAPAEVVAIVGQLARALSKAHERGIVHRDVKPSNVFLLDAGGGELFVKLLDFGIAKGPEVGMAGSTTRTGTFVGSPYYMSPEQVVGAKQIDFRTDLWSLGVVAYEALTAEKPFFAETVGALALKIHRDPLPVLTSANGALPAAVDAWFARACAREPGGRFASAKEMADALAQALTGTPRGPSAIDVTRAGVGTTQSGLPLVADARSETGAGVGLGTGGAASRGKWWLAAAIGAAVVGAGFVVPKLVESTPRGVASSAMDSAAAVATPTSTTTTTTTTTTTPTATASATATPTPPPTPTAIPTASSPRSLRAAAPHSPLPSAPHVASAPLRPGASATAVPGSDDDIK